MRKILTTAILLTACADPGPYEVEWRCDYGCEFEDPYIRTAEIDEFIVRFGPSGPSTRYVVDDLGCLHLDPIRISVGSYPETQPTRLCPVLDHEDAYRGVVGYPRTRNGGELTIWRVVLWR